jgi:hypothetical protein
MSGIVGQFDREAKALLKTLLKGSQLFWLEGEAAKDRFALGFRRRQ